MDIIKQHTEVLEAIKTENSMSLKRLSGSDFAVAKGRIKACQFFIELGERISEEEITKVINKNAGTAPYMAEKIVSYLQKARE